MATIGIYSTLNWPVATTNAVALSQAASQLAPLVLNGTLASPYYINNISFTAHGFRRNVTATIGVNLGGNTFHVRGIVNGTETTEDIVVGSNSTVAGAVIFDSIIEITLTTGNATTASVGVGLLGFLNLIVVNSAPSEISCSTIQLILYTGTIDYSIYQTAERDVATTGKTLDELITNGTYILVKNALGDELKDITTSSIYNNSPPILNSSFLVKITASNAATKFKLIYMQL